MNPLLVFVGGGVGAVLRYGVGRIAVFTGHSAPVATLTVNIIGCFVMGLLAGWFTSRGGSATDP